MATLIDVMPARTPLIQPDGQVSREWLSWFSQVQRVVGGQSGDYLLRAGGTMAGDIAMDGNKVTGLGAGAVNGDALRYEQLVGLYALLTGATFSGNIAMGGNKVTGLGAGSSNGDALRYEQLVGVYLTLAAAASTYLALAGGTLTGALAGTTADFSGEVEGDRFEATGDPAGTPAANTLYKANVPKAWVNFDGAALTAGNDLTGVRDQFNISGIVDNGAGTYTVYFDRDFANANYAVLVAGTAASVLARNLSHGYGTTAVGSVPYHIEDSNGTALDTSTCSLLAIGDQS